MIQLRRAAVKHSYEPVTYHVCRATEAFGKFCTVWRIWGMGVILP